MSPTNGSRPVRVTALLGLIVMGCSPAPIVGSMPKVPLPPMRSEPTPELAPPGLPHVVVADLAAPDRDVRFARNGDHALIATRSGGRWLVGPVRIDRSDASAISASGEVGGMRPIAEAPENTPAALHRHASGFLLVWVEPQDGGRHRIQAIELDPAGQPLGAVRTVAQSSRPLEWVDVLSDGGPTFLLWDAQPSPSRRVEVVAWLPDGVTDPLALDGGRGWHAVPSFNGLWMASTSDGAGRVGSVGLDRIVVDGRKLATTHRTVSASMTALGDVQVAGVVGGAIVAWTDATGSETQVRFAAVGEDGSVGAPRSLDRIGGHALVGLTASGDRSRALLAWERERSSGGADRLVRLATLQPNATPTDARSEAVFESPADTPQLFGDGDGFGLLTLAPLRRIDDASTSAVPVAPTFLRLGPDLRVRASEPIRAGAFAASAPTPGLPLFVQSAECEGGRCTAVARGAGTPSPLAVIQVPSREPLWAAAARPLPAIEPPLAESLETVMELDRPAAEFSAIALADGRTLLAWVEASPNGVSQGARLLIRFIEKDGTVTEPVAISEKAAAVGGIALEALPPGSEGAAVIGWVGLTPGPQMFVARLGKRGEKLTQRLVTMYSRGTGKKRKGPSDMRDVDLTPDGTGGFLCSWSDSRDGALHVFVARLDSRLDRQSSDLRVTASKGDATEAKLIVIGGRALVVWSESASSGAAADLHLASIEVRSLEIVERGHALVRSAGHSRSPSLVPSAEGATLAWIEESLSGSRALNEPPAEAGSSDDVPGVRFVQLDANGRPLAQVKRIPIEGDAPTVVTLRCIADGCRGLVVARNGTDHRLDAIATTSRTPGSPTRKTLAPMVGGANHTPRVVLSDDTARAYVTQDREGRGVVRRLNLIWDR